MRLSPWWQRQFTMKPIEWVVVILIFLLIGLVIPLIVRADDDICDLQRKCEQAGHSTCTLKNCYVYDEGPGYWERVDACLAKMEAAMRAMELYFMPEENEMIVDERGDYQWKSGTGMGLPSSEMAAFRAGKSQWQAVKAECWRTP